MEAQLRIYRGDNIELLADSFNINFEEEIRRKATEEARSIQTNNIPKNKSKKYTNSQRQTIGELISQVKKSQNITAEIGSLIEKIGKCELTENDLLELQKSGINIEKYKSQILEQPKDVSKPNNQIKEPNLQAQIEKKTQI